jgi:hypothetical protein
MAYRILLFAKSYNLNEGLPANTGNHYAFNLKGIILLTITVYILMNKLPTTPIAAKKIPPTITAGRPNPIPSPIIVTPIIKPRLDAILYIMVDIQNSHLLYQI